MVRPEQFGAIQNDANTTVNLQRFFDYFNTIESENQKGDFSGSWVINSPLIIEANNRSFVCGKISIKENCKISEAIQIRTADCLFNGKLIIAGTNASTTVNRSLRDGVSFASESRNNEGIFKGITDELPLNNEWSITEDLTTIRVNKNIVDYSEQQKTVTLRKYTQENNTQKYIKFNQSVKPLDMGDYVELSNITNLLFGKEGVPDEGQTTYFGQDTKRNKFKNGSVNGATNWGIDLRGQNIGNTFDNWKFKFCGSANSENGTVNVTINSVIDYGGVNSVNQGSELEIDFLPEIIEEKMLMKIGNRWHYIDSLYRTETGDKSIVNVFPWVEMDAENKTSFVVVGGGVITGGGDVSGISFNSIDAMSCGNAYRSGGLYGINIKNLQCQFNVINFALGYGRGSNNIGTTINTYYRENDLVDFFQVTRVTNATATIVNTNYIGLPKTEVLLPYTNKEVRKDDGQTVNMVMPINYNQRVYNSDHRKKTLSKGKSNFSEGMEANNNSQESFRVLADDFTLTTKWNEEFNLLNGNEGNSITILGTGVNGSIKGSVKIQLSEQDKSNGITLNGDVNDLIIKGNRNRVLTIHWVYDYSARDWRFGRT